MENSVQSNIETESTVIPETTTTEIINTEGCETENTETQTARKIRAKKMGIKEIYIKICIFGSLGFLTILGIILFFYFRNQDRQNGVYGIYVLNFQTKEINPKVDDYVLTMNSSIPVTVGIELKGVNTNNLKEVKRFYADANNGRIFEEIYSSGANGRQYFALPRGGEYSVGADIEYNDGTMTQSKNIFSGPKLTIWPDVKNENIPIASLKTDRNQTSLYTEVVFYVITKIAGSTEDFETNKIVLWDFDGDGTRDRQTAGTSTRYRYTQSNSGLKYEPKVAVVYKGFTGNAIGNPIMIK